MVSERETAIRRRVGELRGTGSYVSCWGGAGEVPGGVLMPSGM